MNRQKLVLGVGAAGLIMVRLALGQTGAPTNTVVRDWEPMPAKNPPPDRNKNYHAAVAQGPHAKVVAATFFGSKDHEAFFGGGELPDGSLVVFGNAWGPSFPESPQPVLLGKGRRQGSSPTKPSAKGGKAALDMETPDRSAFVVLYAPGLSAVRKTIRFDWGVFGLSAGNVAADGKGLLLAGRGLAAFETLKDRCAAWQGAGTVCILRLSADGGKIEWVWQTDGALPDTLWQDKEGNVYFDAGGLKKISADGRQLSKLSDKTRAGASSWLLVDLDGSAYFGGDRNTKTGREPWRQPFFYQYDPDGKKAWACWEFNPRDVSSARGGLESDSSVRGAARRPDGTLVVTGWSDGGNSVFQRCATDWKKNCPDAPLGWSPWYPKGANSYAHVMIFDPKKQETRMHLWWCGYLPMNFQGGPSYGNRTSFQSIRWVTSLADGAIAFTGNSGTGLIQTPNALWKNPGDGKKYGGETCVILNRDLSGLLFSSYLPGIADTRPIPTRRGLLVVGRSTGDDGQATPTPSPAVNAAQPFAGATDAYAFYLEIP